jgi:hypothetical protein
MKMTKLSLAAIVAVSALGSFAGATSLEETIKNIDVDGFARLRYQNNDAENATGTTESIRISGELNLVVPVSDGLTFGTTIATDGKNTPRNAASSPTSAEFDKYYFLYTGVEGLSLIGGKYTIPAPWTESGFAGSRGNGLVALYSGVPNWTFAGAAYLQTDKLTTLGTDLGSNHNLYALGAIGKTGPVEVQVWAANLEKTIDATVYAQAKFIQSGFSIRGQVNYLKLHKDFVPVGADDAGLFYGAEGGYSNDKFFVTVGYTQTDAKQPIYALDDDNDGFIKFGQQLYYQTTNYIDTVTAFIKGGVSIDKFGLEAGYGFVDSVGDRDIWEAYALVNYQYAKNFGAQLYYSKLDDDDAIDVFANDEIRLQLLYTF